MWACRTPELTCETWIPRERTAKKVKLLEK